MRPSVRLVYCAACAALCLWIGGPVPAAPPAAVKPMLLRDNPLLQEKITLEATDRPLSDCLAELSSKLKVELSATSQVADQRVTLRIANQPLYLLMERLPALLSHAPPRPRGYYWEKLERPVGSRPVFNLWRDLRSVQEEEYLRGYPRREAGVLLRDLRNLSRLTPKERLQYKGDYPYLRFPGISPTEDGPEGKALKGLTDEQLEALLSGEKIPLDPALFANEISAYKKRQRDDQTRVYAVALSQGLAVPEPPDVLPALSLSLLDENGESPNQTAKYELRLQGITAAGTVLDVYDTNQSRDPSRTMMPILPTAKVGSPQIDLTPLLEDKTVTRSQREDVGFNLQALAKAAHLDIYQEDFFSRGATWGYDTPGLTNLKGTLPQLIAAICAEWNYHAEKIGDDYVFWSRTWALDRETDVPERFVAKWRSKIQKQGALTLEDNAEIAASLTWPQVKFTLKTALPDCGRWDSLKAYKTLRLIGLLQPAEREAAFSADGLALSSLSTWEQQSFAADFRQDFAKVPSEQLNQAVLMFQTDQAGTLDKPTKVVRMFISANGQPLFGTTAAVDLPSPASIQNAVPKPATAPARS